MLDPYAERWTPLPRMSRARTGLGFAAGPDGRLYALGEGPLEGCVVAATFGVA